MAIARSIRKWLSDESNNSELFHVDMNRLVESEQAFVTHCHERLRKVHRPSWPDFLVESDGKLYGVEVKTPFDRLSINQVRTFDLLTKSDMMDIYVWVSNRPNKLIRWQKAKRERK